MASWGIARRLTELCLSGAAGQVAVGKRLAPASVRLPLRRRFHYFSQRSSSSCISASSLSAASESSIGFPRPGEISWQKGLCNSVNLIGRIAQSVSIKYLDSGKIVATTSIRVKRPNWSKTATDTLFIVQFWEELAEIAAAHLKKEDQVYIKGSVWVESYMDKESVSMTVCKVVANDLKFVGSYQASNDENIDVGTQHERKTYFEDLWKDYFENPSNFWDNRASKLNLKAPDFKHKSTGAGLWVDNKSTPLWVHKRFGEVPPNRTKDEKTKEGEKMWQLFFADPSDWWDNRTTKKGPNYPDFRSKTTGDGLWVESSSTPSWVKSQLEILDSKAKFLKGGDGKVEWGSASKEKAPKTSFEDEDLMFF